jgi:hypothetical protein
MKQKVEVIWSKLGDAVREKVKRTAHTNNERMLQRMSLNDIEFFTWHVLKRDFKAMQRSIMKHEVVGWKLYVWVLTQPP